MIIDFFVVPAVVFTNHAGLVAHPARNAALVDSDAVRFNVHHLHLRGLLRRHEHVRLYGGRGKCLRGRGHPNDE